MREIYHKKFFWLGTYILGVGGLLCRERPQEAEDFASAIGDETESSSTTNNLFFNRKGKPKRKLNSIKQGVRNQVLNAATKISKSITKVLPDTKIILHESSKEFNKATGTDGRGFFSFDDNIIHIDMNKANTSTVFHEVGHAFIFNTLGETNTANALKTLLTSNMIELKKF